MIRACTCKRLGPEQLKASLPVAVCKPHAGAEAEEPTLDRVNACLPLYRTFSVQRLFALHGMR